MFPQRFVRCGIGLALVLTLAACSDEPVPVAESPRPVRVIVVEGSQNEQDLTLSGTIAAAQQVDLSFRVGGRVVERPVSVGDSVEAGQVLARLDPINEENAVVSARSNVVAAEARFVEAELNFNRQRHLYERDVVLRARLDNASQMLTSAQSALEDAQARFEIAKTRLNDTELVADAPGVVIAVGAETGEVVQPGQAIVQLARDDGLDAVFDAPADLLARIDRTTPIAITLTNDANVGAEGRVREVAPQADRNTGTFRVRVGLTDPPAELRLGSTVTGRATVTADLAGVVVPATALTGSDGGPAVWVLDPDTGAVSLRSVEVAVHRPYDAVVTSGLSPGETIVTAGVQALRPDQVVRVLGSQS